MVDAGAKGFLLKDSDISEVRDAILTVSREEAISRRNALSCNPEDKTPRA